MVHHYIGYIHITLVGKHVVCSSSNDVGIRHQRYKRSGEEIVHVEV